jgi:TonB family protein
LKIKIAQPSILLLGLFLVCGSVHAASGEVRKEERTISEKLAVLDLKAQFGIEKGLAEALLVIIREEMHSYGKYTVMTPEDLQAVASRDQLMRALECDEGGQCLINFGRAIGARFIVIGSLSKLGSTYTISLRMLDTKGKNAGVVNRVSHNYQCTLDDLVVAVQNVSANLIGRELIIDRGVVEFKPGEWVMSKKGSKTVERYRDLLAANPNIGLSISGYYDPKIDSDAMKILLEQAESERVAKENMSRLEKWQAQKKAYEKISEQKKAQNLKEGKIAEQDIPPKFLQEFVPVQPELVTVSEEMLGDLSDKRVGIVYLYFTDELTIEPDRVWIVAPPADAGRSRSVSITARSVPHCGSRLPFFSASSIRATTVAEKRLGSNFNLIERQYHAAILGRLHQFWSLPEYMKKNSDLMAVVVITITKNGQIVNMSFESRSGNRVFDQFVAKTIEVARPLPPIPAAMKKQRYEIGLRFKPGSIQ